MGSGHSHKLHVHGHSVVHRMPAQIEHFVTLVLFLLVVIATPRTAFWAFGVYALLLAGVIAVAGLQPKFVLKRMVVEIPFVVFALILPFVATGPKIDVFGISVSEQGLLGAWNILVKGTLGVVASITLGATTEPRDLIVGLQKLRLPPVLVQIMAFMLRYTDVVGDDMRRMKIARESRGFEAKGLGTLRIVAQSAGALFIRSYERGERVHLAMLSRGYTGSLPILDAPVATTRMWATASLLPFAALIVAVAAWMTV